ncbi:iron ABC transporter permease [Aliiglaciecola sp. LCG003]|uniref:FecCD family ABC transporter permease n=1 Tax=Aliiglaciecola sp. LCG003 TaxID=3053655 RepID=UPI002572D952|nr:iron ABC transporter permease [Aliiglaciecola sp. LCG003]WJG09006.1 iron ABC transporter permease [Aliiglaciecola sp. LCG003]
MNKLRWGALVIVSIASLVSGLLFGAADISTAEIYQCVVHQCRLPINEVIFWQIRVPRILVGFLVGAGLAVAGATLQNVYRNGLADPYLFGVVSGAGLGASIATLITSHSTVANMPILSWLALLPFSIALPLAAFLGAIFAVLIVQMLASRLFGNRTELLLLAGVAVSFMLSSVSHLLLYLAEPFAANKVIFWLLGSLARSEMWFVWVMLPVVMVSVGILWLYGRHMDAMLLGDESAKALGVKVDGLRTLVLMICAALTACIVAYCGGIGFVGLMIPHIVRSWLGVTSRTLILGCVLIGGSFLIWVDVAARMLLAGQEIPIGIITSAIGSIFFLVGLRKNRY